MALELPPTLLPPHTTFELSGSDMRDAVVERIYFHGGVLVINHEATWMSSDKPRTMERLSPHVETVFAMAITGMNEPAVAKGLGKSIATVGPQKNTACRLMGVRGTTRLAQAVPLAFQREVFITEKPITLPSEIHPDIVKPDDHMLFLIREAVNGKSVTALAKEAAQSRSTLRDWSAKYRNPLHLRSVAAATLFACLGGFAPDLTTPEDAPS